MPHVAGHKSFVSQAPVGAVLSMMFVFDDLTRGLRVLNMSVPFAPESANIADRWETMGMRGTASQGLRAISARAEVEIVSEPHVPDTVTPCG